MQTCENCMYCSVQWNPFPFMQFSHYCNRNYKPVALEDTCEDWKQQRTCEQCEHFQWLSDEDMRDRWCLTRDVYVGDNHPACAHFEENP